MGFKDINVPSYVAPNKGQIVIITVQKEHRSKL